MPELAFPEDSTRHRARRLYAKWLPLAFFMAAAANLVLTLFLPPSAWPIRPHEDGSLTFLVHDEQPSVNRRYGFYMELDDATAGGVLVVPSDSFVQPELAEGFADFEVVEDDFDPSLLPEELNDQPQLGIVETDDGDLPFFIVPGDGDLWWLAVTDEGVFVVPDSVAAVPEGAP
ncbi:MAG: hypothetical protein ACRDZM_14360 [Acidimicrobiia bacterium]